MKEIALGGFMGFFRRKSKKVKKSEVELGEGLLITEENSVEDDKDSLSADGSSSAAGTTKSNSAKRSKSIESPDVYVVGKTSDKSNTLPPFKMMERQEVFAPDLTSPVITALISENIQARKRGEPGYGITDVMKLISAIPDVSDSELEMVIRTIASFGIDIKAVIKEAIEKERLAKNRIDRLNNDVAHHKEIIKQSNDEINLLQVGLVELERSKDCLIKGMRLISESETKQTSDTDGQQTKVIAKHKTQSNTKKSNTKKSTAKTKRKTVKKSAKPKTKKTKSKVSNAAETVELTSINLDVEPIKGRRKSR